MAKLEGVKTVDMVNGEITKVEYEGAMYVKIDGSAIKDDLVTAKTEGTIFDVADGTFSNEEGKSFFDEYDVFRKVSEPLCVGDYAKVVDGAPDNIGVIAEITDLDFGVAALKPINSSFPGYSQIDRLRKVTDEEVAEAKAELKRKGESEKWAKIGRKPNEFKKGDIVRYISDGEYCEVVGISEDGRAEVKTRDSGICFEKFDIELVTPAEARFDA